MNKGVPLLQPDVSAGNWFDFLVIYMYYMDIFIHGIVFCMLAEEGE